VILSEPQIMRPDRKSQYDKDFVQLLDVFSVETAEEFLRNNNLLYYWRHVFDMNTIQDKFPSY
jgi:hypothetical protein